MIFEAFMEVFTMFNMNNKKVKQRILRSYHRAACDCYDRTYYNIYFLLIQLRMEQVDVPEGRAEEYYE